MAEATATDTIYKGSRRINRNIPSYICANDYRLNLFATFFFLKRLNICGTIRNYSRQANEIARLMDVCRSEVFRYRKLLIKHGLARATGKDGLNLTLVGRMDITQADYNLNGEYHTLPLTAFSDLKNLKIHLLKLSLEEYGFRMLIASHGDCNNNNPELTAGACTIKYEGAKELKIEISQQKLAEYWNCSRQTAGRILAAVAKLDGVAYVPQLININRSGLIGHKFTGTNNYMFVKRANITTIKVEREPYAVYVGVWRRFAVYNDVAEVTQPLTAAGSTWDEIRDEIRRAKNA